MKEIEGIHHQMEVASPEAKKSMVDAELKNAAAYKAEKMSAYAAWSDPRAIAERKLRHEQEAAAALERGQAMARAAKEQQAERNLDPLWHSDFSMKPLEDKKPAGIKIAALAKPPVAEVKPEGWMMRFKRLWSR